MCQKLTGYTHQCVISFIDLYQKTKKNFKEVQEVNQKDQIYLCQKFVEIGKKYKGIIRSREKNLEVGRQKPRSTGPCGPRRNLY